jgi:hypothetical protein
MKPSKDVIADPFRIVTYGDSLTYRQTETVHLQP